MRLSTARAVDWGRLMSVGVGAMRLAPEVFWSLSPREFSVMSEPHLGTEPLGREGFEALSRRWPDDAPRRGHGGRDDA